MGGLGPAKIGVLVSFLLVLGVPFAFRPPQEHRQEDAERVVIITPHNEQIRFEFARAFDAWHQREYGRPARIEWRNPGGTSEIRRQLQSVYSGAISNAQLRLSGAINDPSSPMPNDLLFGGGSWEHGQMKVGVTVEVDPRQNRIRAQLTEALDRAVESGAVNPTDIETVLAMVFHPALAAGVSPESVPFSARDLPEGIRASRGAESVEHLDDACRVVFGLSCDEVVAAISAANATEGDISARVTLERSGNRLLVRMPIGIPAPFEQSQLDTWFGENSVGAELLYDPDRFWIGTALSGFGIVYNRDMLARLGLDEPTSWRDLCDPRLVTWVALADPRQSGSVATAYDSILNNYDWDLGWQTLRELAANARYFANSAPKVPIDVSQAEAAIGIAIDFYGRYQAQAIMESQRRMGQAVDATTARVGYIDPPGEVYIDADPITLLRGGPHPEIAHRFIRFVLSDEGQALWQFRTADSADNLGPQEYELRRMPVRRDFIREHIHRFVDQVDPFEIASETPSRGWRSAVGPMMGAMGIDTHAQLVPAWRALNAAREAAANGNFPQSTLDEMERLFYAMPIHTLPDGTTLEFNRENYARIRADWRARGDRVALIGYRAFFKENYREIVRLWEACGEQSPSLAGTPTQ